MSLPLRSIVAMIQVYSMSQSIEFYRKLGFEVGDTFKPEGENEATWASLQSGTAEIMLSQSSKQEAISGDTVLFYIYCDDVEAKRTELQAAGILAGPMHHPFYSPKGEFKVVDPDGYVLMITHT